MVPSDASDSRRVALEKWVVGNLGFAGAGIEPASTDASFRRYFRITRGLETYIVMDAPPVKETLAPFVSVARSMAAMGLNVPIVLARDDHQGFLLLSDLGSRLYLDELEAGRDIDRLYDDALAALVTLQIAGDLPSRELPKYDRELLLREMELCPAWFCGKHLGLTLTTDERRMLDQLFDTLVVAALAQPACFVHRDYHSRNLLVSDVGNPGILDFQDAVHGPVTYDAVSLLKDCYIAWPQTRVHGWLLKYRRRLSDAGFALYGDEADFIRWFDLMGLQRHLKVLGIFARLFYRDDKSGYLKDLPRVLEYVRIAAATHPEAADFAGFLTSRIDPAFAAAPARVGA